ncbi:hypothetical protein [Pedobacter sp. MW01-1-1]|uniref:hypothetical protein n=1 Tax=Pedobacter sp. MW01-1-1 TaxID=3383027 RepID=UPI003FF0D602
MTDLILDDNLDIAIEYGDFVLDDAEEQHQQLILIASKGSFRASPLTGVNIGRYVKRRFTQKDIDTLKQQIRLQFQYDGYSQSFVQINSFEDIQINANR